MSPPEVQIRTGHVGTSGRILIDREKQRNALSSQMSEVIAEAVLRFEADPECRAILICGSGDSFSSGADTKERSAASAPQRAYGDGPHAKMLKVIGASRVPVIAAVEGWAAGMAVGILGAATHVVGADESRYWLPEVGHGYFPFGVAGHLVGRMSPAYVVRWALSAAPIEADEARDHGLVTHRAGQGAAESVALALLEELAALPRAAVEGAVSFLRQAGAIPSSQEFVRWCEQQMTQLFSRGS